MMDRSILIQYDQDGNTRVTVNTESGARVWTRRAEDGRWLTERGYTAKNGTRQTLDESLALLRRQTLDEI
jgi:hypothetical protein